MSYAQVSTLDDGTPHHQSSSSSVLPLSFANQEQNLTESLNQSANSGTVFTSAYTSIPAAAQVQWMDDFYQGKPGIVAVFDRNGHLAGRFQFWSFLRLSSILIMLAILYWFMGVWVAKTQNDEDLVILDEVQSFYFLLIAGLFVAMAYRADLQQRQQHVAITTEGIRIDQGMAMTIIIPFETMHSCEAHMTTKYLCGKMEDSQLTRVQVVRSLAPMEQIGFRKTKQFDMYGLVRPQEFVDLVNAFKNSQQHGSYAGGTELMTSYRQNEGQHAQSRPQPQPQPQSQLQFGQYQQQTEMVQPPPQVQSQHPFSQQSQIVHDDSEIVTAI